MSYPGSKGQSGVHQRIIGNMPPHQVYIEAFLGSGRIFHLKRPAELSILIDKHKPCLTAVAGLPGVNVIHDDGIQWLRVWGKGWGKQAVVYCDPPYVLSTRQGRLYYEHEMTDADHVALIKVLRSLDCHVLLSGYPSDLYSSRLQDWRCSSYRTRTRGRTLTECLWCNFPEPEMLHDWRFAGLSYRERLTFKRLATRWLTRLQAMPGRKRGYVIQALLDRTASDLALPPAATPSPASRSETPGLALASGSANVSAGAVGLQRQD